MDERNKNMIIDIKKYCMKETSFLELMDDAPYVFSIDFYIGKEGKISVYCDFEKSEFMVETYDADDFWILEFNNFKKAVDCVRYWSYEISNGFSDFNARDVQHMIDIYDKYQEINEIEVKYKKLPEYIRDILSLKKFTYFLTRNQEDLEYLNDGDDPFEYDSDVFNIIDTDIVENEIDSVVIPIIKKLGFSCGWGGELTKCELKVNEKETHLRFKYRLACDLQNSDEKNKIYNEINAYDDKKIYLHDDEYEWYECEYDEDDEVYIYLHGFIYFYY